jgi:hypothetical protein
MYAYVAFSLFTPVIYSSKGFKKHYFFLQNFLCWYILERFNPTYFVELTFAMYVHTYKPIQWLDALDILRSSVMKGAYAQGFRIITNKEYMDLGLDRQICTHTYMTTYASIPVIV